MKWALYDKHRPSRCVSVRTSCYHRLKVKAGGHHAILHRSQRHRARAYRLLVNAANERLAAGGGVCGAIFEGAGANRMAAACAQIGRCPTGSAVTTPGFDLPCRWVIHAVGPIWRGGTHGERELLRSCYCSVFAEVTRLGATSVAFPLISAGIFGYPVREALDVARAEASAFLDDHPDVEVTLVVFTRDVVAQGVALLGERLKFACLHTLGKCGCHRVRLLIKFGSFGIKSVFAAFKCVAENLFKHF